MSTESGRSLILVATEVLTDAELVRNLLRGEFAHVAISTDPARAVADFDEFQPDVLVLAFAALDRCQAYYQMLRKESAKISLQPHRTLLLCRKSELKEAFALCRDQVFDDYVLFWPLTHDSPRLLLAVHQALRDLHGPTAANPNRGPLPAGGTAGGTAGEIRPAASAAIPAIRRPPPLVLFVDDDHFQHGLMEAMLASEPVRLRCAGSAAEAFEIMAEERPSLILLDIGLPLMDGVETTRRIRAMPGHETTPIAMFTGLGTRTMVLESLKAGANEFVVKPVERTALLEKVRRLLALSA